MKVLMVFGTRPEIIKLAPVYRELVARNIDVDVFWSGQHTDMADGLIDLFGITVNRHGRVCHECALSAKHSDIMDRITSLVHNIQYDYIIVQGDTTTAAAAAMSGFLNRIPVAHVEAGLRTYNFASPWPEEYNRRVISLSSTLHFCPTLQSMGNVRNEHLDGDIYLTGNTVVDALLYTKEKIGNSYIPIDSNLSSLPDKKIILATMHRRENIGDKMKNVLKALKTLSEDDDKVIVLPVHLNPQVQKEVYYVLDNSPNVILTAPLQYTDMVWLMNKASCVVSDSGGIQEEAPTFGLKVFITRDTTERPEVLKEFGVLVDDDHDLIVESVREHTLRKQSLHTCNPFGDGHAAKYIVNVLVEKHSV